MSDFPEERLIVQTEQLQTRGPVSESLVQTMGGSINKVLKQQVESIIFAANGAYKGGLGRNRFDGFYRFRFNATIINVQIFNGDPGLSGTTEVDILKFTSPGGVGASIFSTTPKVNSAAAANVWARIGEVVTGVTAPVLTSSPNGLSVNAGDVLQAKFLQVMDGNPKDLQIQVDWLPR